MAVPSQSTYSVHIAGPQARVMLGTGTTSELGSKAPQPGQPPRQVVVTPLTMPSTHTQQVPRTGIISKVLISLVPRPLEEGGGERAWYILIAHAPIFTVILPYSTPSY